jgi:hypothetical protein
LGWSSLAALVVATGAVTALYLPYNQLLVGDPSAFPLEVYLDQLYGKGSNALGFGPNRGLGWALQAFPGHSPANAAANAALNAFSVNIELFGWSLGSVLLIAALLFSGAIRHRDWSMVGVVAVVVGAYSLYWYHGGPDFGARYWFLILVPCAVLTVRGIQRVQSRMPGDAARGRVVAAVIALCAMSILTYFPWRAVDKYHNYELMSPQITALAQTYGFGNSLVLIRGDRHPDYMSAAAYNPLDVTAEGTIFAWDRDPTARAEVVQAYPDRPIWIVDGPTRTHAGYQVVAGPLSIAQVLDGQ